MANATNEGGAAEDLKMYRPPQNEEPTVQFEDILNRIRNSFNVPGVGGGGAFVLVFGVLILAFIIWLATGIYTVGPDEQAALRTFGRFQGIQTEGLHYHWPAPIGNRNVVSVTTRRQLEVGFRSGADSPADPNVEVESLMITGDENIVSVHAVIQYRISDLRAFLFSVDDPGEPDRDIGAGRPDGRTLRDIAETAIRQVIGARPIDDALTTERQNVATDILLKMQELVAEYNTGIQVLEVLLQDVTPPAQVQSAFEDVVKAGEERETKINQAEAYAASRLPQAQGEAAVIVEAAQAFKDGRIARAQGEADGFLALLEGYQSAPDVTRRRLYLEAMEEVLPGITKFIVDNESGVLPFLPLDSTATPPAGGGQ